MKSLLKSTTLATLAVCALSSASAQTAAEDRKGLPATYTGPASAVAAIVNDKVITSFDVQQRIKLMLISSGGRITPQMMPQLQRQALRDLVEEQLKLQEAKEFDLKPEDGEVAGEIRNMAAAAGLTAEQLIGVLEQNGISAHPRGPDRFDDRLAAACSRALWKARTG